MANNPYITFGSVGTIVTAGVTYSNPCSSIVAGTAEEPPRGAMTWVSERPRTRTILVGRATRRIELPQYTTFLIRDDPTRGFPIYCWASDEPVGLDTPLYVSPFNNPRITTTHVYPTGIVCFGAYVSAEIGAGKISAIDAFWGSGFSIVPDWLGTTRRDVVAVAPRSTTPGAFGNTMGNYTDIRMVPTRPLTPRQLITSGLFHGRTFNMPSGPVRYDAANREVVSGAVV